ncbi:hypothetical protein [Candidatus Coxiella mudrowiae]|uniref:Uncharacterized protein n=1 Tax=Candidatus Coxiella mudrowiae TaxID=2054173 RepID=A0ABM5UUB4_9COXI|nr:hypothetical protein [Candidatus Coxiella mudrowiae]AKQ33455.1 hypothetical protein CleRT_05530 [Candidatus Coxiella mudrowiae]AKQ33542.1 hypothetical protein CleRT_06970 [Candidatus Coxiella mudrowiae]
MTIMVYNGTSAKVSFAANFHGPFSYSGNVAGKQTTYVYGEGYGTSTLTLGDLTNPAGECVVTNSGGTDDYLKYQANGDSRVRL